MNSGTVYLIITVLVFFTVMCLNKYYGFKGDQYTEPEHEAFLAAFLWPVLLPVGALIGSGYLICKMVPEKKPG